MKQTYMSNVVTLNFTEDKCTGCARCIEVCPHGVFEMKNKRVAIIERDCCMECGACELNCAFGAITVKKGVGCASAMINGIVTKGDPDKGSCGCEGDSGNCC